MMMVSFVSRDENRRKLVSGFVLRFLAVRTFFPDVLDPILEHLLTLRPDAHFL